MFKAFGKRFSNITLDNVLWGAFFWCTHNFWIWASPMVVGFLAHYDGFPVSIIFTLIAIVLAFAIWAQYTLLKLLAFRTPRNKLRFGNLAFINKITPAGQFEGVVTVLVLHSIAEFPIEFRVEKLDFKLNSNLYSEFSATAVTHNIDTNGVAQVLSKELVLTHLENRANSIIEGSCNIRVSYGKRGNLKYLLEQKYNISLFFDGKGTVNTQLSSYTTGA